MTTVSRTTSYVVVEATPKLAAQHGSIKFIYDDSDPYAVRLVFGGDGNSRTWRFGRDLLADGLTRLAGFHDVACWTEGVWFHLMLSGPRGRAIFKVIAGQVRAFLIDAEELVPYGSEALDFDSELDALLKGGVW